MTKEVVLLPECRPGKIEKQCSHLEAQDHQQCAKNTVHERRWPEEFRSASRLLESGDALGNIAIVNIHGIDLGEAFECRFHLPGRLLAHAQIIPQGESTFRVDARRFEGALIPDGSDAWLAFFHERKTE